MSDINVTIGPPDVISVTIGEPAVIVTLGAEQGPAGPPGGELVTFVAEGALSGHSVVAETAPGAVVAASADDLAHVLRVVGVTAGAAIDGAQVNVRTQRALTHGGWAWTPGLPVYLGLAGALSHTAPAGARFIQVVGVALTPTSLLVAVQPPVLTA